MNTYIKTAAILFASVLMAGGFMQKVYGATYVTFNVGGYTFLQPWLAVDPGQTWQQMAAAKPAGYDVASLATVNAAMAAASITAGNYSAFVTSIGGTGSSVNPAGCPTAKSFCYIFLADPSSVLLNAHRVLLDLDNGTYTGTGSSSDNVNNSISGVFAGMLYVQTPEPSLSLLLGSSLMGLGYLAHRRKQS